MSSLVLTRFRPDHPQGGAALRNWQNVRALSKLGPVDVVSVSHEQTSEPVVGVREWLPFPLKQRSLRDRVRAKLSSLRPNAHPAIEFYYRRDLASWLKTEGSRRAYSVAVVEELSLASYLKTLHALECRVVFDAHNVESTLRAELAASTKRSAWDSLRRGPRTLLQRRLAAVERHAISAADLVWACSDHDAREIERTYAPAQPVATVPNGVDVDAYRRPSASPIDDDWRGLPVALLFVGTYSYLPNEAAAMRLVREVLPAVRARGHRAQVILLGRDPTPAMRAAAKRDPQVQVTGAVASILPYLEARCVVTLPISLGSGTRLKILESFAVGRPVVCSRKAAEGIEGVDGEHLLLRETPEEFADAALMLWEQPSLRARLCTNALALVRERYSWDSVGERIASSLAAP